MHPTLTGSKQPALPISQDQKVGVRGGVFAVAVAVQSSLERAVVAQFTPPAVVHAW